MLELKNIVKEYPAGGQPVEALKGVSLQFRESEFVSILGPSGCGKTTLLNIIGGLDQYTSGDLVINGRSTKDYKDLGRLPQPLGGLCVPKLQPHPPPDGAAKRGAGPDPLRRIQGGAPPPRQGGPGAGGLGQPAEKAPQRDVRRPDAACGHCPGHCQRPGHRVGR